MPGSYCPHCGEPELTTENQHRYQCQACQFEFFMNVAAAVGIVLTCEDKVLVVRRGREPQKGQWDLPGGFVDQHESVEQALIREIFEELGMTLSSGLHYLGAWPNEYPYKSVHYHTLDIFFTARADKFPDVQLDNQEVSDCQWISVEQLTSLPFAFESASKAIQAFCLTLPDSVK